MTTREQYLEGIERARAAAQAYYLGDGVHMDDAEYDALITSLRAWETLHPGDAVADSPTQVVGGSAGEVAHAVAMLSLDNVFSSSELHAWLASVGGAEVVVEPKLDGLALAATYSGGKLVRLVTRGDGKTGEDVTYAAGLLVNLPDEADGLHGEVRGEVVFTKEQFEAANEARIAAGETAFVNARNGAAGALRGAADRTYPLPLSFFAYDFVPTSGQDTLERHSDVIADLRGRGFAVSSDIATLDGDVEEAVTRLGTSRDELIVDVDGAVVKVNDKSAQAALGSTARAPRWAVAYKYPADTAFTKLVNVEWQVGRTGVITPRAEVEPVHVGGVTITYATLHNPDDIARRGFKIGDTVSVYRAGEVIPRIEAPLVDKRTGAESDIVLPSVCPNCEGPIDTSEARWRCAAGRGCGLDRWVTYACSRDALDIEGLGGVHAKNVVQAGLVSDVADVFTLTVAQLASLDRMGERNATKIVNQIEAARGKDLGRVVTALGIRGTGRTLSRRLAEHFQTLSNLAAADVESLCQVEGIGAEKAELIANEVADLSEVIDKLIAVGVNPTAEGRTQSAGPLSGLTVCITGSIPGMTRTQASEAVERLGGKAVSSVSSSTDLLVAGEKAGSKAATAAKLGVRVITHEAFLEMTNHN